MRLVRRSQTAGDREAGHAAVTFINFSRNSEDCIAAISHIRQNTFQSRGRGVAPIQMKLLSENACVLLLRANEVPHQQSSAGMMHLQCGKCAFFVRCRREIHSKKNGLLSRRRPTTGGRASLFGRLYHAMQQSWTWIKIY